MVARSKAVTPRGPHQTLIQRSRNVSPSDKAEFTTATGRVLRQFFGLSASDEDAIVQRVTQFLDEAAA